MNTSGGGDAVRQRRQTHEHGHVETSRENVQPTSKSAGWTLLVQLIVTLITLPLVYILYIWLFVDDVFEAKPFSLESPPALTGPLALNNLLQKAERMFDGEIIGPESIVHDKGHLYAGTADGKIIHIENGNFRVLASFGKPPCGKFENEATCGRPLGMRLDKEGYLIVLDAYLGLFKLNTVTGDFIQYFSSDIEIDGEKPKFLNDLDIAEDGTIYFTDSSTKWPRKLFVYSFLEADNTGRLVKYDPNTNSTEVLVKGLHFPNGVQLSSKQDFLIFSETILSRIWKYYLKGSKKGDIELFIDNLPGMPDNIRRSKSSPGFWVALPLCRNEGTFSIHDFMAPYPWLRSFIVKAIIPKLLITIGSVDCGRVIQLDTEGNIVRSLHDFTGKTIHTVSEVEEDNNNVLYLGSFRAPYMGKLDLNKL